ncbi:hypothetical protein GUITHDRAFT_106570 [Guillardia theta CCMP2712]|uniref:Phosducin thioredoxin-like domain-containing protein n=1 Tax=Guillardia theta (strain CCMP2712) TaxID=905079 RepID=L1JHG6_GUITC|nr:hypothetical protein GUITHDRAFT_106570 [Guillardia theta CCMP2712]EKX47584.1 hypothetical protein GUITHDRAFT_106570 [Guillardia theta CCMP2712]|eukprot:XP_005834564.1 hypothetical protein GUITHDRAFT_106570 [Guillardia theta CCMP2712]
MEKEVGLPSEFPCDDEIKFICFEDMVDFEHDPTMAMCCRREMRERTSFQVKLDTVRKAMPAPLVDKSRIFYEEEVFCKPTSSIQSIPIPDYPNALTEDEIDRALEDVDDDAELMMIRNARMEELVRSNKSNSSKEQQQLDVRYGEVEVTDAGKVLQLIMAGVHLVVLVDRAAEPGSSEGELSGGILKNMRSLAHQFVGTCFLCTTLNSRQGDELRGSLHVTDFPALVCCRHTVIVSRVMGAALRQFVLMDSVGAAVFQAWLNQAGILHKSKEDCQTSRLEEQRGKNSAASRHDESEDESDSGSEDEGGSFHTSFQSKLRIDRELGSKTFSRAQMDRSAAEQALGPNVCRDTNCCHRGFFHEHLIGGIKSKSTPTRDKPVQLHPHDTH